ncbi:outer membrane protein assembly factor BamB family protein [Catenuloplanes atrovinosus]|uniref:Outer membrane protein assembly factor BamB n=1 Tax=Catenuloplanes atrovinosus TaxID=137266 RepID=A0AAE3YSL8_9ACTN|nr:PQQ-binding-like beta-propeller repeat protein [Catenuloplanes atrovinosus]MDR7277885.1 outer membrane protein assembly factor BamB [Catenuloplanes atrovinosus]
MRRRRLVAALATIPLLVAVPAAAGTGTRPGGGWSHAHGDAGHTGYQPVTGGLTPATVTGLHDGWRVAGAPHGKLVAAGGALYLPASEQGTVRIRKLDARTGRDLPFGVRARLWLGTPAAVDDTIVTVASDGPGRDELRAYSPTGAERWRAPMPGDAPADDLAVHNGLVFVGGGWKCRYTCEYTRFRAYRLTDGTLAWEQDVAGDAQYEAPAVAGDTLIWPMRDATGTRSVAFDAATGSPRWSVPTGGGLYQVAVTEDALYTIEGDQVCARHAGSGGARWCRGDLGYLTVALAPQRADAHDTPAVLYAGSGDTIRALDPADGRTLWSAPVRGEARTITAGGGLVFAQLWSPRETRIAALDASDGRVLHDRVLSREGIFGTVVPAYGRLFAVDPYQAVLALEP